LKSETERWTYPRRPYPGCQELKDASGDLGFEYGSKKFSDTNSWKKVET
jgi:hypothetical protein